ncbi:MAG: PP2C family protein-serine/threonine phosphatase [Bacteroidia bacterium]
MDTPSTSPDKPFILKSVSNFFENIWEKVLQIGVTDTMPTWETKRTRLLNSICFVAALVYVGYVVIYSDPNYRLTFWECFQAMVAYCIPIFLNYKKQYKFAIHFFMIYNILCYGFFAIAHGKQDASEYMFLPSSLTAMLFFRNRWLVFTYFLLNVICFFVIEYIFTIMKPFFHMYNGENFYYSTHAQTFLFIFLVVNFFKIQNTKQEKMLESKNQNLEIQKQLVINKNELIEGKQKEILDSITYAKRIQQAILPSDKIVEQLLPESFILYKPKDIVSGDFYWTAEWGSQTMFAAVDCTGHGVPGAFMSIVGQNILNQAVNEHGLTKPSLVLNALNKNVSRTLGENGTDQIKDGMDIALCSYDKKQMTLQFAGAFNPLWILRGEEIIEVKGNKFPIGSFLDNTIQNFDNHEIKMLKGDIIYIFTDGYADQFGGPKGKKFKYKNIKKMLLENKNETMQRQKEILDKTLNSWKGELEQIDDILIIGVKI